MKIELQIAPERIGFLKFILEGYDGMAVLSTIDSETGRVLLRFPPEAKTDIEGLLTSLVLDNRPLA